MIYYILAYILIGLHPAHWLATRITNDFESANPPGSFRVRFKLIDGLVYNTVYGLAFLLSLVLMPLTWFDYIVDKIKGRNKK
jgi:hypothetical protein